MKPQSSDFNPYLKSDVIVPTEKPGEVMDKHTEIPVCFRDRFKRSVTSRNNEVQLLE